MLGSAEAALLREPPVKADKYPFRLSRGSPCEVEAGGRVGAQGGGESIIGVDRFMVHDLTFRTAS